MRRIFRGSRRKSSVFSGKGRYPLWQNAPGKEARAAWIPGSRSRQRSGTISRGAHVAGAVRLQDKARQVDRRQVARRALLREDAGDRREPHEALLAAFARSYAGVHRVARKGERRAGSAGQTLDRRPALRQHERRSRSGILCRRDRRGHHHRAVALPAPLRHRPQLDLHLQGPGGGRPRRSAGSSASATSSKGACAAPATGCASPASSSMPRPAPISGPTGTTATSRTCSSCRIGSPHASSGRSRPRSSRQSSTGSRRSGPTASMRTTYYLRALAAIREMTRERNEEALGYVERALQLEPDYAVAAGLGAWAYTLRVAQDWCVDLERENWRGIELARLAIAKGGHDASALAMGGYAIAFLAEEFEDGLSVLDRAVALNPNRAMALSNAGWVRCYRTGGRRHRRLRARHPPQPARDHAVPCPGRPRLRASPIGGVRGSRDVGPSRAREQPQLHAVLSGARRGSCPSWQVRRGESSRKAVAPAHTGLHDG